MAGMPEGTTLPYQSCHLWRVKIEQPSNLPAVIQAVPQQEQKKAEESTAEIQDKKHPVNSPPTGNKTPDQKRP
jgi:hypothetical protein